MSMEKKERKKKIWEWKNEKYEKEKEKDEVAIKIWEGCIKWKKREIKCKEGCHVVERWNFHSFSNHVQSDNEDIIGAL
jgi:hypothetical protein